MGDIRALTTKIPFHIFMVLAGPYLPNFKSFVSAMPADEHLPASRIPYKLNSFNKTRDWTMLCNVQEITPAPSTLAYITHTLYGFKPRHPLIYVRQVTIRRFRRRLDDFHITTQLIHLLLNSLKPLCHLWYPGHQLMHCL
jgi:hypothetical protein